MTNFSKSTQRKKPSIVKIIILVNIAGTIVGSIFMLFIPWYIWLVGIVITWALFLGIAIFVEKIMEPYL